MSNFIIYSLLGLVLIDLALLLMILCHNHKSISPENIIAIIGEALRAGDGHNAVQYSQEWKSITLPERARYEHISRIEDKIKALCEHLNIKIEPFAPPAERYPKYMAMKKGKKA